ncbi:MAG: helix-turn-helix transcriptional regulator [Coriobacteriales bacterium]|jgi:DNA-binding CsgD family transcriptional regulator|nr:helix-turn-helix transcriptional regulator [Coriobacteriales bacterium]
MSDALPDTQFGAHADEHSQIRITFGFGALIGVVFTLLDGSEFLDSVFLAGNNLSILSMVSLSTFVATALFMSLGGLVSPQFMPRGLRVFGLTAAFVFAGGWFASASQKAALLMVTGGLLGICLALLCLGWLVSLSRMKERLIIRACALALLVGTGLKLMLLLVGSEIAAGLVCAMILIAVCLLPSSKSGQTSAPDTPTSLKCADTAEARESLANGIRGTIERNWLIYCGLLLGITIAAGVWSNNILSSIDTEEFTLPFSLGVDLGTGVAALLLFAISLKASSGLLKVSYLVLPLFCVGATLVVKFFDVQSLSHVLIVFSIMGLTLGICGCLHIAHLSAETKEGFSRIFVYGMSLSIAAGVFMAWSLIMPVLGEELGSAVDLSLKVLYLVLAAAQIVVVAYRQPEEQLPATRLLSEHASELAEKFKLSPRESEILLPLLQGRSSVYIAESQYLSVNTVNTHVKRIYAKAKVHSKQELLNLVHTQNKPA